MDLSTLRDEFVAVARLKNSADQAKFYKKCLLHALCFLYEQKGWNIPADNNLLVMLDSPEFALAYPREMAKDLHFVRLLGSHAEHGLKVNKKKAELASQNLANFLNTFDGVEVKAIVNTTEANTRTDYIDVYLNEAGWEVLQDKNLMVPSKACIEIEVEGMPTDSAVGICDYVLYGRNGKPLAIIEAKKNDVDLHIARQQVILYGDCMKKKYGYTPILYYTNGYTIKVMDDFYPDREISAFHSEKELELLLQRQNREKITDTKVDESIAGRPYQKMAITSICERFNDKHRRGLLVMATGTGKTRVAVALTELLARNNWVKNVLFLADRTALVAQAKKSFSDLMPNMSVTVLSQGNDKDKDMNARLIFSTYQTMINYIDAEDKIFTTGRFDLIIIDEAHRSVFNKYGTIFTYFDSLLVGLTATPKGEIDKNTYSLFGCEQGVPNYDYSLDSAVKDGYLVNYQTRRVITKVLSEGIKYSDLTPEQQQILEASALYSQLGNLDEENIGKNKIFKTLYVPETCDLVLEDLMTNGLKVHGGETIGKTIIFAYNQLHAQLIVECFHRLFPKYGANYCQRIDNSVKYADSMIDRFREDKDFRIAVSVDMLDTGVDVPEVCNLVFFKPVKSKIKFAQMIGRGTRLCKDLFGYGEDKQYFLIFDYCSNFEYFEMHKDEVLTNTKDSLSLSQRLFEVRLDVLAELQKIEWQNDTFAKGLYDKLKTELQKIVGDLALPESTRRMQVRTERKYVDKYADEKKWLYLAPVEVTEMKQHLTKLLEGGLQGSEAPISFDIRMFMVELALLNPKTEKTLKENAKILFDCALSLLGQSSIPQIMAKESALKELSSEAFWSSLTLEKVEKMRQDLREIMSYLEPKQLEKIKVHAIDFIVNIDVDQPDFDFRTYRQKVIEYLAEHTDHPVISKIKHLEKINADDMKELEHILWVDLGTKDDYKNISDTDNLAVFIRSLIGVDQQAINEKFSAFLQDNTLNLMQQEFISAIITYVRQNGDITSDDLIYKSPFCDYSDIVMQNPAIIKQIISIFHDSISAVA